MSRDNGFGIFSKSAFGEKCLVLVCLVAAVLLAVVCVSIVITNDNSDADDHTLYAGLTANTYTVTFDSNGGTGTMTFPFTNPRGWEDFAAYYVATDGTRTAMDWTYDKVTGLVTVTSTHNSVYAMLKVAEEPESEEGFPTV